MKIFIYSMMMLILTSFIIKHPTEVSTQKDDVIQVLKKTSEKLNSLEEVSYSYFRSINYFSEDYHSETMAETYLKFDKSVKSLDFKFQIEDENTKTVYNSNEFFSMDKQEKTITIKSHPNLNSFENLSFLLNSVVTLKNSLPTIISDREIQKILSDTIINKKNYYLVSFVLENKTLNGIGNFSPITLKREFLYKIVIDKNTFLPFQVIQTNNTEPKDYMLTSFNNIKTKENSPPEFSWYYSTYNDYKEKTDTRLTIIKDKLEAPNFKLSFFDNDNQISLKEIKSKFILIEFWIKNCGYCIQAVPKLNDISNKFDKEHLQVVGINGSDDRKNIKSFYEKNKPLYKTLYDENGKITRDFGVDAFPQVVLLDTNRKVVYSGSFNEEEIEKILTKK